jgi:predicted Na+-dependent transporter
VCLGALQIAGSHTCDAASSSSSCNCVQVVLGATLGIMRPSAVTWLDSNRFTYALGFLMLSMGLTLTVDDFKKVTSDCTYCMHFLLQALPALFYEESTPVSGLGITCCSALRRRLPLPSATSGSTSSSRCWAS